MFESIIDIEDIQKYEKDIGKQWREDIYHLVTSILPLYQKRNQIPS